MDINEMKLAGRNREEPDRSVWLAAAEICWRLEAIRGAVDKRNAEDEATDEGWREAMERWRDGFARIAKSCQPAARASEPDSTKPRQETAYTRAEIMAAFDRASEAAMAARERAAGAWDDGARTPAGPVPDRKASVDDLVRTLSTRGLFVSCVTLSALGDGFVVGAMPTARGGVPGARALTGFGPTVAAALSDLIRQIKGAGGAK